MNRSNIPQIRPPDENLNYRRHHNFKMLLQTMLLCLMVVPAIITAVYKRLFPGRGISLRNKVALVTGAGRGLGRGLAIRLAEEGCKVACVDISEVNVVETARIINLKGLTALSYNANVALPEDIRVLSSRIEKDLGPVDVLVNNAAIITSHRLTELEDEAIHAIISVNFISHFWMIRTFLPSMKERNSGHIVAISSMSAFGGLSNTSTYTSCKWALTGLMECVREELREIKNNAIKVTTVFPYFINTSADYTSSWKISLPERTIEEVVDETVRGIKQEKRTVNIPEHLYYLLHLLRFLPSSVADLSADIFKIKLPPFNPEEKKHSPWNSIVKDTLEKSNLQKG
uniref:Short-chain dehydrogenase/reductase 3 n=1 Tax=Clastoptera arizonana TaxID=38151 RepID=A0A1B6CEX8_9HEMI